MNAKIIFSDAPYWNKRSLKISNHLVLVCIFYRPEGDQFFTIFMVQNHKIEDIFTMQCDWDLKVYMYMLGNNVHKHAKFQVDSSIDV